MVFSVSAALSVLAGLASLLRGKRQAPLAGTARHGRGRATTPEDAEEAAEEGAAAVADPEDAPPPGRRRSP